MIVALGVAASALTGLLLLQESRHPEPIISLEMFRQRLFAVAASGIALISMSLFGVMVFMSLYFQLVMGVEPYIAGLLLAPQIAGMICTSIVGGNLVSRTGRYKGFMIAGSAIMAISLGVLARLATLPDAMTSMGLCLFANGVGIGLTMPNLTIAVQNAVDRSRLGQATATMAFMRSLGGSLGVALFGGLMTMELAHALARTVRGLDARDILRGGVEHILHMPAAQKAGVIAAYQDATGIVLLTGAGVAAIAFLVILAIPELPLRARDADQASAVPGEI